MFRAVISADKVRVIKLSPFRKKHDASFIQVWCLDRRQHCMWILFLVITADASKDTASIISIWLYPEDTVA
jgi:hypothetical protein